MKTIDSIKELVYDQLATLLENSDGRETYPIIDDWTIRMGDNDFNYVWDYRIDLYRGKNCVGCFYPFQGAMTYAELANLPRVIKTRGRVATEGVRMVIKYSREMTYIGSCDDPQYKITKYNKEYRKVGVLWER